MTWEQTAAALAREVDRLQKENDRLNALIFPAVIKLPEGDPNAGNKPLVIAIKEIDDARWTAFGVANPLASPTAEGGGALGEAMSVNRKMKAAAKVLFASGRITRDELHSIIYHDDEGGGAAIGGESKPLVCHEMTAEETAEAAEIIREAWEGVDTEQSAWEKSLHEASLRALKTVWWNAKHGKSANGGESQALQAAILGLHTLAGGFPTPTWKTREDYLQATISEINEILGKQ